MMGLIPWRNKQPEGRSNDLSPLVALRGEMDRLFDTFLREPFQAIDWPSWGGSDKWSPAVDIAESDKEMTIQAELPGIDPKELDVSVTGNQLVLSGEKRESSERKEKGVYHSEARYGSFRRVIPLPEGLDTEHIDAQYANGVLTLKLPKTASTQAKRIEVKAK
ncbi:MAG: Hsp20/alpha crystallin family protein [Planctomycetaceae bacterium]|nr:Hsp20/alpha crystallin family protein [Planctomycetaceae bacterium]